MSAQSMLEPRMLYSMTPPDIRTKLDDNPTLLVSWWATGVSLAIILTRVFGRYVRIERFFREDKVMMLAIIPLLARMAFIHVVLIWGTNNTKTKGLSEQDIQHRIIGSKLVLAARVSYAIFIWAAKLTVCEFLHRIAGMTWRRSLRIFLTCIYYFLASTLIAVVIATLTECQPFSHNWQVIPDPGPKCRSGYANLITMGVCDVITDLLLVAFPIPMIMVSNMPMKRKATLVALFALSLILVGITCYRVPSVIQNGGSQQYRSLLASLEILAATAVSNAVVISSFVRDRGVKKLKYKKTLGSASVSESLDHSNVRRATITHHQWGSDSDLARDLGMRLDPGIRYSEPAEPRPAPVATPYPDITGALDPNWSFSRQPPELEDDQTSTSNSLDMKVSPHDYIHPIRTHHPAPADSLLVSPDNVAIFDVGGLLDRPTPPATSHNTPHSTLIPLPEHDLESSYPSNASGPILQDVGGLLSVSSSSGPSPPQQPPTLNPPRTGGLRRSSQGRRRTSSVHFSDSPDSPVPSYRTYSEASVPIPEGPNDMELQDVGGLLSRNP